MATKNVGSAGGGGTEAVVGAVRERYGRIATGQSSGCCGSSGEAKVAAIGVASAVGYRAEELQSLPEGANLGLGCGAPLAFLAPAAGETVLDLGSGAGVDALLAARAVGREGRVIGVDMTPEMIARARANAATLGLSQAEFREGRLEALPVAAGSVDAVTSNCVINLVPDKAAVFAEVARVLKPGGRLVVSDIVLRAPLPPAVEREVLAWVGCVAGAMVEKEYFSMLRGSGLADIEVLRDVDYLELLAEAAPEPLAELEARTGVSRRELAGRVRSVTYRAVKSPA